MFGHSLFPSALMQCRWADPEFRRGGSVPSQFRNVVAFVFVHHGHCTNSPAVDPEPRIWRCLGMVVLTGGAMGLLAEVIGGVLQEKGGSSGMEGALQNLLGGGQQNQTQPSQNGSFGNFGDLVAAFERAGLGPIIQSWISQGPNQPVSPDQLQNALGQDRVTAMSQSAGMASQSFLSELSQHLPEAVDRATPNGKHPDDGTVSV